MDLFTESSASSFAFFPTLLDFSIHSVNKINKIRHSEELREIEEIRLPREGE